MFTMDVWQRKKDVRTDGRMDNRTDGRTFSYIDSRTDRHLVMQTIELQTTELKAVEMKKRKNHINILHSSDIKQAAIKFFLTRDGTQKCYK